MPKKICIVSNKRDHKNNLSKFIDSCDIVIRVNKMDNITTGKVGKKLDLACVWVNKSYIKFDKKERNVELLKTVPLLYVIGTSIDREWLRREDGIDSLEYPPELCKSTCISPHAFSGFAKAVALADYLYKDDNLYLVGDIDCQLRTGFREWDLWSDEDAYMKQLIDSGRAELVL